MPFSTRRSSTRGTPRGLLGRSGAITRHSKSVRSYRLMHMLNQISHATPIPFMGLRPSSQSWGKRQDRWLLLNPKNANVELETNDSQTAARALGLELTLLRAAGSRGTQTRFLHGQSAYERSINDRSIRSIACSIGTGSTARYPTNGRSCASRTKNADDAPTA